ncbi:MAG: universal stress protein [Burkholderiaceae bacterium]
MRKILIPCDGSDNALRAVRYAASIAKGNSDIQLELLYVQDPVLVKIHAALTAQEIDRWQSEEADLSLQPAKKILESEGVPYQVSRRAGAFANEIARHVREKQCDAIIMGTRGMSPLANVMIGSVATKVVHLVDVPVTLIK